MTHFFSGSDQQKLEHWEHKLGHKACSHALLEKWIFVRAAGVLFAKKTGELIIMKKNLFGLNARTCKEITASFCSSWNLEHRLLYDSGHSLKIILFHAADVDRRIDAASKKILHCVLKNPFGIDSATLLAEVAIGLHTPRNRHRAWIPDERCMGLHGNNFRTLQRKLRMENIR